MKGVCACGAVGVETAFAPAYVNFCNCSLCRRIGAAWGYFEPGEVTVTGETAEFARSDIDEAAVVVHFCAICGTTTHWTIGKAYPATRMGVNVRLFEEAALAGVEARFPDGRNWDGSRPTEPRCDPARFGDRPLP